MNKLSLKLDDLTVESFDTAGPITGRGTVQGHGHPKSGFCSENGSPCDTYTCHCTDFDTCEYSCGQSCPNTCDSCQATCISCMNTCEGYAGCTGGGICID